MALQDKAMIVRLSITQWTARKLDKDATQKAIDAYGADADAGRFNKSLIARREMKKITRLVGDARTFHYANTLPWKDTGDRILPVANYRRYCERMTYYHNEFEARVDTLVDNFPELVEQARIELNGMFKASDYPDPDAVRAKFTWTLDFEQIPAAGDFRLDIGDAEVKRIRQRIEDKAKAAEYEAMNDLWSRVHDAVAHMAQKLADPKAIFRDSLVNNLTDLVDLLPRLNVTGDQKLEEARRAIEQTLTKATPELLRRDLTVRQRVASAARQINKGQYKNLPDPVDAEPVQIETEPQVDDDAAKAEALGAFFGGGE